MSNIIETYHTTRSCLDLNFIKQVFVKDERELLNTLISKYPNQTIRMPNSDLVAEGFITGIGGVVV